MTTREEFKKAVIEAIHGLPYEEAIKKETVKGCLVEYLRIRSLGAFNDMEKKRVVGILRWVEPFDKEMPYTKIKIDEDVITTDDVKIIGLPITAGRVIAALHQKELGKEGARMYRPQIAYTVFDLWGQLTKDGKELTDDSQTDETIEALLKLLK